ncbi:3-hydroxyisobutyryl-CoA hydrolase mitochondrial precursor [Trichodelitschia bisporula]|uniref:3-hydroxyisobutyryl-CoA hydrolase n=1 Tax=Trichodelitschia bisporula TaxID=703511 RepID=A0A6G1HLC5_9PEZI|nr:3-hydroxyisobutyryl-CoA hydrolase mitochondrial precursor [Trichodelitschia bisporula]
MPLKAKITNPTFGSRTMVTETELHNLIYTRRADDPDDVTFTQAYGLRTIELNRPKKLNSLNASMARKIIGRLWEWEKSDMANIVVIQGAGRAFCAGGDVAELAKWNQDGPEGQKRSSDYFALEYKLDHMIAAYRKPYVAYMDGITMGGGVGLSVHAPFRIATENTVFAMPETTIGFFPDVGASFFLPKMDGNMGTYLALTSEQLKGVDVFYHGIATHFIHSTSLPALSTRLAELRFEDYATLEERYKLIASTIAEYNTGLPAPRPNISGRLRQLVDSCFAHETPAAILKALEEVRTTEEDPALQAWADKTIKTIRDRSPISVAVTLRQMAVGKDWNIAQTFQREHGIASRFMAHPDFVEGVSARLIRREKGRPNWQPAQLEDVQEKDVDAFFAPPEGPELALLESGERAQYREYPHAWLALPTEAEIVDAWKGGELSTDQVVERFLLEKDGKVGIREKVEEVLERHRR